MIYMLVRSKNGIEADIRVQELFQNPLFDRLRSKYPNFREKIHVVSGDCSQPGLGLSSHDRAVLLEHVHIVFHMAATVRFNEKLKTAICTNISGTKNLMLLCRECCNIKVVMHVSTAFSHCPRADIDEKFYDLPITSEKAIKLVDCLDENLLSCITPVLQGDWPNTYTFTKAIAEEVVRRYGKSIPVGIFRPSIIVCTSKEPVPGWTDNLYGPAGVMVGVGKKVIRAGKVDGNSVADLVPCDMVVSALISSAWDVHQCKRYEEEENILIYNYVSSCENPITWGQYIGKSIAHYWLVPFYKSMWMVFLMQTRMHFTYKLYTVFLHLLPGLLIDITLYTTGQRPMMLRTYEKIHRFLEAISYFSIRQWKFSNRNVQQLWQKLSPEDQKIFDFSINHINWDEFSQVSHMGIRTYLLKDDPKTVQDEMKRRYRLYWLHQFVKFVMICLMLWGVWGIVQFFASLLHCEEPPHKVETSFSGKQTSHKH